MSVSTLKVLYVSEIVVAYPADSVLGPTLLSVPAEELFFFVIQTYIVSGFLFKLWLAANVHSDDMYIHFTQQTRLDSCAYSQ